MKKRTAILATALSVVLCWPVIGCSTSAGGDAQSSEVSESNPQDSATAKANTQHEPVAVKASPDKYTHYVKDYIGSNAASIGYTALDNFRRDRYGNTVLKIIYVASDGTFIDPTDEDALKQYVVFNQNVEPNTEIKITFQKQEDGTEYDNLVDQQNIEEIVLAVKEVGTPDGDAANMTPIEPSPDAYTRYMRDYVGRNLAECGYLAISGSLCDQYGRGYIQISATAEDGSYIDASDKESLATYVVTSQSVPANSEISMEFMTDSNGEETSLVDSQSIRTIDLRVKKLD